MKIIYLLTTLFSKSLILDNIPLLYHFANKYKIKYRLNYDQYNDIVQEGSLGLIRASEKYDHSRGIKFSTYGSIWIKSYMGKYIKDSNKRKTIRLNEELINISYLDTYPILNFDINLTNIEKEILYLRYDRCKSFREIGEIIGVNQHTVIKWHKTVLVKLTPQVLEL